MASKTLTSWALLIWKALQHNNVDAHKVFKLADVNPALLGNCNARYPVAAMYRLWHEAAAATNNPAFGVNVGKEWSATTFNALGFAWLASDSLKEGFGRLQRYSTVVNDALIAQFHCADKHYIFTLDSSESINAAHRISRDAWASAIIKMSRLLYGDDFTPIKIIFRGDNLVNSHELENYARCPIIYNEPENSFFIDRYDCEKKLPTADPEMAILSDNLLLKRIAEIEDDIIFQVKNVIHKEILNGPLSESIVAEKLHTSERTLQRKLNSLGTNYQQLFIDARKNLAQSYIRDTHLSLNEIAYLLGFSDQANFTRAFKAWHKIPPSQYRRELQDNVRQ